MNLRTRSFAGFTLVELLVVVGIIALLVGVVAIGSGAARQQSRDAKRKADLQSIAGALELYRLTNHQYPQATGFSAQSWSTLRTAIVPQHLPQLPSDPKGNASSDGMFGRGYVYATDTTGSRFALDVALEAEASASLSSTQVNQGNSGNALFYVTGTYVGTDNRIHYRVSSGQ